MTSKVILYKNNNWTLKVLVENENVWMIQEQIWDLFWKSRNTITEHINNIYEEWELNNSITIQKISNSGKTGK